jgi:hypothetical protein
MGRGKKLISSVNVAAGNVAEHLPDEGRQEG